MITVFYTIGKNRYYLFNSIHMTKEQLIYILNKLIIGIVITYSISCLSCPCSIIYYICTSLFRETITKRRSVNKKLMCKYWFQSRLFNISVNLTMKNCILLLVHCVCERVCMFDRIEYLPERDISCLLYTSCPICPTPFHYSG